MRFGAVLWPFSCSKSPEASTAWDLPDTRTQNDLQRNVGRLHQGKNESIQLAQAFQASRTAVLKKKFCLETVCRLHKPLIGVFLNVLQRMQLHRTSCTFMPFRSLPLPSPSFPSLGRAQPQNKPFVQPLGTGKDFEHESTNQFKNLN